MKRHIIPVIAGLAALILCMPATANAHGKQKTCREFTQVDRHGRIDYGTACLQPNGTWLMIDRVQPKPQTTVLYSNGNTRITMSQGTPFYTYRDNGSIYRFYTNNSYGYRQRHYDRDDRHHGRGRDRDRDRDRDHRH